MRNAVVLVVALLCISFFPQSALADSIEYSVSIDVTWSASVFNHNCSPRPSCDPTTVVQFASAFDEYANGSLVPGSMIFLVSGAGVSDGSAYAYDTTPPSYPSSVTTNSPFTAGSLFNWSNASTTDAITFLPPGCSYTGPPSTCVSASWPPSGDATYDASTVSINAFSGKGGDPVLFSCWSQACPEGPSGPDNLADGGSVVISEFTVTTPEPSSLILLGLGLIFLFAFGLWRSRTASATPTTAPRSV